MNNRAFACFGILASVTAACATTLPPEQKAAEVERFQCDSNPVVANEDVRILERASVISSEPLYSHVLTGADDSEQRVDGAKLVIRPPDGVSAERMTRIIQCHAARALLGKLDRAGLPDDPFWLPDTWVSVEVRPENGNYAVVLEANDVRTNLKVAAGARRYALSHALAAAP
jgi:hypothetical protein